jgi:ribonucleoside-diphosphate reductase alpha chain
VRLLDDALLTAGPDHAVAGLQVGLMGFADAMARLGVPYDSEQACHHARDIARALAEGCLRGSIELAAERGARIPPADCRRRVPLWQARGMPQALIERACAIGLRHGCLTGLDAHPLLARLANGVSDGFKPGAEEPDGAKPGDAEQALLAAVRQWIDAEEDPIDAVAIDAAPTAAPGSLSSHPV